MFKKFKKKFKAFMTGKSGFSLVELIVVIAIMAVMAAVLAPALLGYVERSRAQKDDSAMGEVTNAIQLSLADQDVYDELLPFAVKDNYSCYTDGDTSTNIDDNKITTKSPDYWLYNDKCRKLDETVYKPAGKMRGVTITLKPNGEAEYILKDGIVNQIGNDSTKKGSDAGKTLADTSFEGLYNRLRSTVGDTLKVSSQTYRNSDYTIFISMGTTGGNQSDKQDAIQVYGQYNGTNLHEVANASNIDSDSQDAPENNESTNTPIIRNGIIPEGGTYTVSATNTILSAGENFPDAPAKNDTYEEGDFKYTYNRTNFGTEWSVYLNLNVTDKAKTTYGEILSEIAGKPVTVMKYTFANCESLITAPTIPSSVTSMLGTFSDCTSLTTAPSIPNGVMSMWEAFMNCKSLTVAPTIPDSVIYMYDTFYNCRSLKTYEGSVDVDGDFSNYIIPNSVTDMNETFMFCSSITTAPVIPNSVTKMYSTFANCASLTGTIEINANPTSYRDCFDGTVKPITLTGSSTKLNELAATSDSGNVTVG